MRPFLLSLGLLNNKTKRTMKKLFLFAVTAMALTSCGGSTENAPKASVAAGVEKDGNLAHELASKAIYEKASVKTNFKVMEYGQPDSCFTEILDFHTPYNQRADYYMECYQEHVKTNKAQAKADLDSAKCYQQKDSVERANFKPMFFGWKMHVKFMTDNIYEGDVFLNEDQTFATLNRYELLKREGIIKN